jgi:heme exporter protein A
MTLQTIALAYSRGERHLFSDLDLKVEAGQALRVVGQNGSGKTSLLRLLCGLAVPDAGEVLWNGREISSLGAPFHANLLFVGHGAGIKDDLSALENLKVSAAVWGRHCTYSQALDALQRVGLTVCAEMPAKVLSQGQRRRLAMARLALLPAPKLVVLDEPFSALDAKSIQTLEGLLDDLLSLGSVVVFTTHQGQYSARGRVVELNLDERLNARGVH